MMKTKFLIALGILLLVVAFFSIYSLFYNEESGTPSALSDNPSQSQRVNLAMSADTESKRLAGLRTNEHNECVADILKAFESRDKELINAKILEWLQKDEALLLASLGSLDNLDQIFGYGLVMPYRLIAQHLYDKYGGEKTMEMTALLDRNSNNVYEIVAASLQAWGMDDLDGALGFLEDSPNFDNTWAATQLAYEQAHEGDPARVAEFFTDFDGDQELRSAMLTSVYENWVAAEPDDFARYINSLDDPTPASSAISSYALLVSHDDPHLAMDWLDSIYEPGTRQAARVSVASQMAISNSEDFQAWFEKQDFPDERTRQDFIESVQEFVKVES